MIVENDVTSQPAPQHRIADATPSRHAYKRGQTKTEHRARHVIELHGGSLKAISTRRAAR